MSSPLAVLGGTFNPIHIGHLRTALDLRERLQLGEIRFMPSAQPPHRQQPSLSAEMRAHMVKLALAEEPGLVCDDRELRRDGPSYTYDSLAEIRAEIGADVSLILAIGSDNLPRFDQWYRWQEILELAHLIIMARPGFELIFPSPLEEVFGSRITESAEALASRPAGLVHCVELRALDISSTEIRSLAAAGRSIRYLVPDAVSRYLNEQNVYQGDS